MSDKIKEIIGEELYSQVTEKMGDKKIDLLDGYIPKARFDEVNTSKSQLKTQVGELADQLALLKDSAKGNEDLLKKISDLQGSNEKWEKTHKDALIDSAIKLEAIKNDAIDPDDILPFVNKSSLIIDEAGKIKGLNDEFTTLKKNKAYLFKAQQGSNTNPGTNPAGKKTSTENMQDKLKKSFGL